MNAHELRWDSHYRWHSSEPVRATCEECGEEWDDTYVEEYGTGWLETHEQCPACGGSASVEPLDAEDIAERRGLI